MKENDYMNRGQVMETADSKLFHYINSAARYLVLAEYYTTLGKYSYYEERREEWSDMARLYRQLCQADLQAAKYLIDDLADLELIDGTDWQTIKHWLVWMGYPAEDRYD